MGEVQDATVTFSLTNKLGVKFRLTETFTVPVFYGTAYDTHIFNAVREAHPNDIVEFDRGTMGDPLWDKICSIPVMDTVDY